MVAEEACESGGERFFLRFSVSAKALGENKEMERIRRTFLGPMGLLEDLRLPMMSVPRFVRDRNERTRKDDSELADVKLWARQSRSRSQGNKAPARDSDALSYQQWKSFL